MPKLTDEQILQAFECCQTEYDRNCQACPYQKYKSRSISVITCESKMRKDLFDLINSLKADNERLKENYEMTELNRKVALAKVDEVYENCKQSLKAVKTEAYKEFAKRAKEKSEQIGYDPVYGAQMYVSVDNIDNILNEKVGDADA